MYICENRLSLTTFLQQAAAFILQDSRPLHRLAIVMPSRRAAVFLERELSRQIDKVQIGPRILTIEELVLESTGLQSEETAALFFKSYEAYTQSVDKTESFDEYSKWGRLFLADCNEIDRHLVDADNLFSYLADVKRIENWDLEPGESNELIKEYLALWPRLAKVYRKFTSGLLADGRVYQGLAYRQMHQQMDRICLELKEEYDHLYFLGFNALNRAEEEIFLRLFEEGLADFYWDIDRYYFEDIEHEAGQFLRQSPLIRRLKGQERFFGLHQKLKEGKRSLESIAVPGNNLQAQIANGILGSLEASEQNDTALVLADEALLTSFLNTLHPNIEAFNLTMGLGLENSPLSGFFELLLEFPVEAERSAKVDKNGSPRYYHRKWDSLLSSFVIRRINRLKPQAPDELKQKIKRTNAIFRSFAELELEDILAPFPERYFHKNLSANERFKILAQACLDLKEIFDSSQNLSEALFGFYSLFNQLAALLEKYPYVEKFETALQLYREILPDLSLDLKGEPLKGLQVMGMLETRALDFKRLVICSLNEGILPKGRSENSLIPFDVKKKYKLPTYLDKDAVYAYHFYRLLQGAEEIYLLHGTSEKGIGTAEASRFIEQLKIEWPQKNRQLEITERIISSKAKLSSSEDLIIEKSSALLERLDEIAEKGLSATALISYLRNPLQFYFERVLRLQEEEEMEEEIEARVQGIALHELLEEFYTRDGKAFTPLPEDSVFALKQEELRALIYQKLKSILGEAEIETGPNLLTLETLSMMLKRFLDYEKQEFEKNPDRIIVANEKDMMGSITLNSGKRIHLKGTADRIESSQAGIRIVDYKTGAKAKTAYRISTRETPSLADFIKKPEAFQLMFYAYLYRQENPQSEAPVSAAILSLRKQNENPIDMALGAKSAMDDEFENDFSDILKALLEELYNPAIPFRERGEELEEENEN